MKRKTHSPRKALRLDVLEGRLAPGDAVLSQVLGLMAFLPPAVSQRPALLGPAGPSLLAETVPAKPSALPLLSGGGATADTFPAAPPAARDEVNFDGGLVSAFETADPTLTRAAPLADSGVEDLFRTAGAAAAGLPGAVAFSPAAELGVPPSHRDDAAAASALLVQAVGMLAPNAGDEVLRGQDELPDWPGELAPAAPLAPPRTVNLFGPRTAGPGATLANVELVDFTGPGNVDIRINAGTDIGNLGLTSGDVEWVRGYRDLPNSSGLPWDTWQSAPAAYVKGNSLTADVWFSTPYPEISSITVAAANVDAGAYGDLPETTVVMQDGWGFATVSSLGAAAAVDVATVVYQWQVTGYTVGEDSFAVDESLEQTGHRVYTLQAPPVGAMAEPWANVLEVTAGLARGLGADVPIVEQMTRVIHWSQWRTLSGSALFLDPQATFYYSPSRAVRFALEGPGPVLSDRFISQRYDLTNFMSHLNAPITVQQCNDNSNVLTLFLGALGIPMEPVYFARSTTHSPTLNRTTFYPAGQSRTESYNFTFHQVGFFNGNVYDPSTRAALDGDPQMGMSLTAYLDQAFPGQTTVGYVTRNVTTVSVFPANHLGTDFTLTALDTPSGPRGTTTNVWLYGAGFSSSLTLTAIEISGAAASGVTITNRVNYDSNWINFDINVTAASTPRTIRIRGARAGIGSPFTFGPGITIPDRVDFLITA